MFLILITSLNVHAAGTPAKVLFIDPPSGGLAKVSPASPYYVRVDVFDQFGNKVIDQSTSVTLTSLNPQIGDIAGSSTVNTDSGSAWFKVTPTNGNQGDTFHLRATLVSNGYLDNARMVVDKNRAKFFIFYADSAGPQNLKDSLSGEVGDRLPVVIRESSSDGGLVPDLVYLNAQFVVTPSTPNLKIFANATDVTQEDTFTLVNGKARIWVSGTAILNNERLDVTTPSGAGVRPGYRENIYFKINPISVDTGIYYSDNGNGQVNRLELYYKQALNSTKLPDSLELYWPEKLPADLRMVKRDPTNMNLDPQNPKHITVILSQPFSEGITTFTSLQNLGIAYTSQGGIILKSNIKIHDCVNPLLASATLLERISQTGNDTMFVRFTETVPVNLLMGNSLRLIKNSDTISLQIVYAAPAGGDTIKIVVANAGAKSPAGGDKLKIDPNGPVRDLFGNPAHSDNRPVIILNKNNSSVINSSTILKNRRFTYSLIDLQGRIICTFESNGFFKRDLFQMQKNKQLSRGIYIISLREINSDKSQPGTNNIFLCR